MSYSAAAMPGPSPPATSGPDTSSFAGSRGPAPRTSEATILVKLTKDQEAQVVKYAQSCQNSLLSQYSMRAEMENVDRQYMRERDWTEEQVKSQIANRRGDPTKFQNVRVPVILPQCNAALTYLSNVFVTGYPIFPVVADPGNEDAALQLETVINENAVTKNWAQEFVMAFRDGLKYNLCALECCWEQDVNWAVSNDPLKANSAGARKILWNGNVVRRMDLYNTFWDPRVAPGKIHSIGEFAGYTELYSRSRFKGWMNTLYNKVPADKVIEALESQPVQAGVGSSSTAPYGYYVPIINPFPFYNKQAGMDWMAWASNITTLKNGQQFANTYSVTIMYARIIPNDFGISVPERNTPQVWKFIIVNGRVVLSAERLTNIHRYIPIFFGQPINDGLEYQTKSFATNVNDMQEVASAMWTSYIASKRRLIGDRVLYDPSRINSKDINSPNPTAKIPVRPSAYGKPLQEAVYPFPFRDQEADSLIQGSAAVINFANLINGQNAAQQGQFTKGNRTRHEFDDIMGHGNGVNQLMALGLEASIMSPLKEVIKLNTLQYQEAKTMYNQGRGKTVSVDPVDLRREAVHFKVCDGLIPSDKVTGDDLLQTVIQQIGTSQQLAGSYNLGPMFTYMMKTQGLDLSAFQKSAAQMQYEQQLSAWTQAAAQAAKTGAEFKVPQPQPSPQLQQEMQQAQSGGGVPSPLSAALEATQGG